MNPQMLAAITPFCDNVISMGGNQSLVRNRLAAYYGNNHQLRNEYIQYAAMYAQALMNQNQPWQNAAQAGAEAVAPIFIMRIAQSDHQVSTAFGQDPNAAAVTAQNAQQAQSIIQSVNFQQQQPMQQPQMQYGNNQMQYGAQTQPQSHLQGAFSPSMSAPAVQMRPPATANAVTLPVHGNPTNHAPVATQAATPVKIISDRPPEDAQPGIPPLFDRTRKSVEYIKHGSNDYFKEKEQMDPNAHNHSPVFMFSQASEAVHQLVVNDAVTGTNGIAKQSSMFSIEESQDKVCTRVLKNNDEVIYQIADLPELSVEQTHICHMPTIDMVIAADNAKEAVGLDASAVRDAEMVEKIIYGNGAWVFEQLDEAIKTSKNIKDFAKQLESMLARSVNASYQDQKAAANIVRINSVLRAFVSILNSYMRVACKKPNISKRVIDEVGDVADLMTWLEKADNVIYRSLMEPVSFIHWINHNFILSMYDGSDNLIIESRKAVVYSTMYFQQLGVSFADDCDKAILTEEINPWLYYFFATHLRSSAGKRLYCPVRYFFSDDCILDVLPVNAVTGQMLVTLVKD